MKIIYLNFIGNDGNRFNSSFEETIHGLSLSGVKCRLSPKVIKYDDIKDYDVVLFDSLYYYWKDKGYHVVPEHQDIFKNKKIGIISLDFWRDIKNSRFKNIKPHFLVARHSSCFKFIDDIEYRMEFIKRIKDKDINEKSDFKTDWEHVLWSPFTINKDLMVQSDKVKKEYDICLGGNLTDNYPLRMRLHKFVQQMSGIKIIDPWWHHAGGRREKVKNLDDHDYYKKISQSWLSVATTGLANISVRKHYEICGLNSTCLGNHTGMEDHELVRLNTINFDMSTRDKTIEKIIRGLLADKQKLVNMSNSVKDKVREQFDYRNVTKKLVNDIENVYGELYG